MWSFSVLSVKSIVAFWSHRVKNQASLQCTWYKPWGLWDISCLEPHTDLGKKKPIASHPSWGEHGKGKHHMEMLSCLMEESTTSLSRSGLSICSLYLVTSYKKRTGTFLQWKFAWFFIHLFCLFCLKSKSFIARAIFCLDNVLTGMTRFENTHELLESSECARLSVSQWQARVTLGSNLCRTAMS